MVRGKVFIADMREEYSQRHLGESRAQRESSRRNTVSRMDLAIRKVGAERGVGKRER